MSRLWRGLVTVALAGGLATAAFVPAEAASNAANTYSITIAAASANPVITHDVWVAYEVTGFDTATVSGQVTGDVAGDVATLYEEPFGTSSFVATSQSVTLPGTLPNDTYSFTVQPGIATQYEVQVFTGTSTTPDVTSTPVTVYLTQGYAGRYRKICKPRLHGCTWRLRLGVFQPPSAYRTESHKHWYMYSVLKTSRTHVPVLGKFLKLDKRSKNATATKARRIRSNLFQVIFTWRFHFDLGRVNAEWYTNVCTKNTESKDGIGLPGTHGCGDKRIHKILIYLGGPNHPNAVSRREVQARQRAGTR